MSVVEAPAIPERRHRLHWWKEALIAAAFYLVYSWTRNLFGSNALDPGEVPVRAFRNAERVIRAQQFLGLYHEEAIQQAFLSHRWFIQFWNTFYGTAHFVVTLAVFILLFWKRPGVFPVWRNSLAIMTAMAIIGFALFPLMPPRLLDEPCDEYGGACITSELRGSDDTFGFVDTLAEFGGPWSFDSDTMADISNQYAAMPSMHIGWSIFAGLWLAAALPWRRVGAVLGALHVALMSFAVVVTGNHYVLDIFAGALVAVAGLLLARRLPDDLWGSLAARLGERGARPSQGRIRGMSMD